MANLLGLRLLYPLALLLPLLSVLTLLLLPAEHSRQLLVLQKFVAAALGHRLQGVPTFRLN